MPHEHLFDLGRCNVLAASDDRVVGAALNEQVPVFVDPSGIAGREPSVFVARRPPVGVATRNLVASDPDLTVRVGRNRMAAFPDLYLDTRQDPSHR